MKCSTCRGVQPSASTLVTLLAQSIRRMDANNSHRLGDVNRVTAAEARADRNAFELGWLRQATLDIEAAGEGLCGLCFADQRRAEIERQEHAETMAAHPRDYEATE